MQKAVLLAIMSALLAAGSAWGRPWKPSPAMAAVDYTEIIYSNNSDVTIVWWFAPPVVDDQTVQPILKKYFVLAVAHAIGDAFGNVKFVDVDAPMVNDTDGKLLKRIKDEDQPPTVAGMLTGVKGVLVNTIGPMGKGMKMFVYESGSVDACKPGKVSIPFGGEIFTYDTPIPGCPKP